MIYQFEHEEIDICNKCPMCVWCIDTEGCTLTNKLISGSKTPQENDCPLVVISKIETTSVTSDGFSYDAKPKQFQCNSCRDYFYMPRVGKYCPNCGRRWVEVKKEDFFMTADLALKQVAISKTETVKRQR